MATKQQWQEYLEKEAGYLKKMIKWVNDLPEEGYNESSEGEDPPPPDEDEGGDRPPQPPPRP